MPKSQVAAVQNFDVGLPATEGEVLKFRVVHGGKVSMRFENAEGLYDGTVSVQVSPDGSTWADTTDADNLKGVVDEVIPQVEHRDYTLLLREGVDTHMRVVGLGETRLQVQIRADMNLETLKI
jgi:hypothetical protein